MKYGLTKLRVRQVLKKNEKIFLDVGSGDKKGENGWFTIDLVYNSDLCWDLRKGIPFPDESVSKIYSSHFLEHLSFKEGQFFLEECLRVLIPSGIFSICVPNAKIYIESYLMEKKLDPTSFLGHEPAYYNTTGIDYVNYIAYMDGEHKYMFDENNLIHILKSKGFKSVRLRKFDPKLDNKDSFFQSIYATAEK